MSSTPTPEPEERRLPHRMLFTKASLDDLLKTRPHRQHMIWDTKEPGLSVLISRGPKHKRQATVTFRVVYYLPNKPGKPRYKKIGRYPDERSDIKVVRDEAALARIEAKKGVDPRRPKLSGDFTTTVGRFLEEHAKQNRTWKETERIFNLYVVREWADKNIEQITKADVSALLNSIAQGRIRAPNGKMMGTPTVARATRAQLVTLFNWYDAKYSSENFRGPIVKLTKSDRLQKPTDRERCLSDDEIRAMWGACGEMGAYGGAVQTALLTAQRFQKVGQMRRRDLKDRVRIQGRMEQGQWVEDFDIGHVWDPTRPDDPKNKRVSPVPLSKLARDVITSMPIIDADDHQDFVFTTTGRGPLKGWSKYKERLDRKMSTLLREQNSAAGLEPAGLEPWQHRDLRRTARTLLARAGVSREVSEHCLAHVLPGIEKVYNRHHYLREKQDAFERLAELIERLVNSPGDNIVPLRRADTTPALS